MQGLGFERFRAVGAGFRVNGSKCGRLPHPSNAQPLTLNPKPFTLNPLSLNPQTCMEAGPMLAIQRNIFCLLKPTEPTAKSRKLEHGSRMT